LYLGGGGNSAIPWGDYGEGIAVDASGLAYVTGFTSSDTSVAPFPTTSSAYQTSLLSEGGNAFLTVVDPSQSGAASLIYSTYLGGTSGPTQGDIGVGVAVDNSGDAYITGQTDASGSTPFPTTPNAYQASLNTPYGNAFVTEISTTQSGAASLIYSTYLGGTGDSTYQVGDFGFGIALDSLGKVYVTGESSSTDFPLTSRAFETANPFQGIGFVTKLDLTQSGTQALLYSTFLGGTNGDAVAGITVDSNGNAVVTGNTFSIDFPTTSGALQSTRESAASDGFLTQLNSTGTGLLYSTYLGGSCAYGDVASGIALDSNKNPYITGSTCSTGFPTYPSGVYQTSLGGAQNAFVTKFAFNANPGITVATSPSPDSSGWNNSSVAVSFTCIPGGAPIQSCTSPTTVSTEGANQVISGTAEDTATNTATTSVTVNLDLTPPSLSITSPTNGASVSAPYVVVSGSVSDSLSGVGGVTCNGASAAVTGSAFSCTVQLNSASNSITVIATDLAGNSSTAAVNVSVGMSAPTSLQITPGPVTMLVGNNQSFAAIDQTGTRRPDAAWSVSNTAIATLATDGSGSLTGVAAGQVTLTATIGNVSAQTQVTVEAGSLTPGTVLWSASPVAGFTAQQVAQAVPTANGPSLYSLETDTTNDVLIRAFASDGGQMWQRSPFAGAVTNAGTATIIPDDNGGVLLNFVQWVSGYESTLANFDGPTGAQSWQYTSPGTFVGSPAVRPDGSIVGVESDSARDQTFLIALDGKTGQKLSSAPIPSSFTYQNGVGCGSTESAQDPVPSTSLGPIVDAEGNTYVLYLQSTETLDPSCEYANAFTDTFSGSVSLLKVAADSTSTIQLVQSYSATNVSAYGSGEYTETCTGTLPQIQGLIPDGQQGVLMAWSPSPFDYCAYSTPPPLNIVDSSPQGTNTYQLPATEQGYGQNYPMVLGEGGVAFVAESAPYSYVGATPSVVSFNVNSGQVLWSYTGSTNGQDSIIAATSDGGIAINDSQLGLIQLDTNGNSSQILASGTIGLPGSSWSGTWYTPSVSSLGISEVTLPFAMDSASVWPQPTGNPSQIGGPSCNCEVQSTLTQPDPPPLKCTICGLQSPGCASAAGSQSTYLLLVGDSGINTAHGNHNVGQLFDLAAQTQWNDLQAQGHHVVACRVSSVQQFNDALTMHGVIDGGVVYFGHAGDTRYADVSGLYSSLFLGELPGFYTNITARTVNLLQNTELGPDATITLNGCNTAEMTADGNPAIGRLIANQLQRTVLAYRQFMHFSNLDAAHDPTVNGNANPSGLPMYMNPDGKPPRPQPTTFYYQP
jgi:hypothetical protein